MYKKQDTIFIFRKQKIVSDLTWDCEQLLSDFVL